MNKKIKILMLAFAASLLGLSLSLVYLSKDISPDLIKKRTLEFLEHEAPNTEFRMGELDYSLGPILKIYINNFEASQDGYSSVKVNRVELSLSLWTFYFGNGVLNISLSSPEISFINKDKKNDSMSHLIKNYKEESSSLSIPGIFLKNRINIKISDFTFKDKTKDVFLDTIQIKNLLGKTSALEVLVKNDSNKKQPYKLQIVGELSFSDLFLNGESRVSFITFINSLELKNQNLPLPDFKVKGDGLIKSEGEFQGHISFSKNNLLSLDFDVLINNDFFSLLNLKSSIKLSELFSPIISKVRKYDFSNSALDILGELKYLFNEKEMKSDLDLSVDNLAYDLGDGEVIRSNLKGTLKDKELSLSAFLNLFNGTAEAKIKAKLDFNQGYKLNHFMLLESVLSFDSLRFRSDKLMRAFSEKMAPKSEEVIPRKFLFPDFSLELKESSFYIDEYEYKIKSFITKKEDTFKFSDAFLFFEKNKVPLNLVGVYESSDNYDFNLNLKLNRFPFDAFLSFFPFSHYTKGLSLSGEAKFHLLRDFERDKRNILFKGTTQSEEKISYNFINFQNKKMKLDFKIEDFMKTDFSFKGILKAPLKFEGSGVLYSDSRADSFVDFYVKDKNKKEKKIRYEGQSSHLLLKEEGAHE